MQHSARFSWRPGLAGGVCLLAVAAAVGAVSPTRALAARAGQAQGLATTTTSTTETPTETPTETATVPQASPFEAAIDGYKIVNNNLDRDEPTLFTIYQKDERVLALIPDHRLGQLWLLAATVASGPIAAGEQVGHVGLEWRRRGEELDLYEPELRYTAGDKPTLEPGVKRVYTDRHVASVPILAQGQGGVLIDLTGFLNANLAELVGSFLGSVDTSAQRVERLKAFHRNVELALTMPMSSSGWSWWLRDGQLQTLHFSFSALPENPTFERRRADPRVGYWVHARRDLGNRDPLGTGFDRAIERWDLRKADPDARTSPPAEPIVFYIEKTVPQAYRVHVRRGIEAWNEAFAQVGIANAIEVRQQTDTQYADIDPEDVRYNFVRWVPSGMGYAIALHRSDPRTGQIFDADVVIDDSWINAWTNQAPLLTQDMANARLDAMVRHAPPFRPVADQLRQRATDRGRLAPQALPGATPTDQPGPTTMPRRGEMLRQAMLQGQPGILANRTHESCRCQYKERLAHGLALARVSHLVDPHPHAGDDPAAPADLIDGVPQDLVAHNLVALVAHEVGHVLGLRHNFAASATSPASAIDQYTDPAQEPPASSVMDYIGTFIAEPGKPQGLYNMLRVGAYDRWAIAYGYMQGDDQALKAHLARSVEPQHRFKTDEDVYSVDPTAMTYDFGSDPVEGRQREMRRIDYLRGKLIERLEADGENWTRLTAAANTLWTQELFALWDSTGWIGGTYLSRDHKTEGAALPRRNVEPHVQRGVLDMLIDRLFSVASNPIDRELANRLQTDTWYDSNFPESWWGGPDDADLLGDANLIQYFVLSDLLFWCTPRMANQELRTDPSTDALTVPEMHRKLTNAIWAEFEKAPAAREPHTNMDPKVSATRRTLQREHAEQLIDLAYRFRFMPAAFMSAQLVAIDQLRTIRERLASWTPDRGAPAGLDDYTRVHVAELLRKIDATLDAQVSLAP